MQDKGVGVFAEFPLRPLDLWGGDLPPPCGATPTGFPRDFGRRKRVRILSGNPSRLVAESSFRQ